MYGIQKKNDTSKPISKNACLTFDAIGKRYGRLPSELKNLDINDFAFNLIVVNTAIKEDNRLQKLANKKNAPIRKR